MKVVRNLEDFENLDTDLVVAFGNFDGVHLGHRKLIKLLKERAKNTGSLAAVFTFSTHPTKVLRPEENLQLLLSQEDKEKTLLNLGIDILFTVPFTKDFARISPQAFIDKIIMEKLKVKGVVVGYNFSFGAKGAGSVGFLKEVGHEKGFFVDILPPIYHNNEKISSTLIRQRLQEGNVNEASKLLGYHPFLRGSVVIGDGRGRTLGFPTANLDLPTDTLVPATGVYIVKVESNQGVFRGVANIGYKPTFNQVSAKNIEIHLLEFKANIYSSKIKAEFLDFIRPEKTFKSSQELIAQIQSDVATAKKYFDRAIS